MSENTNIEYTPFIDSTGANLNRRKLKIVSQTPDEIIVDIERCDTSTVDGTPLNATFLNDKFEEIKSAIIAQDEGSTVYVNNVPQYQVYFSDNPQEQINNEINARTNSDTNLQTQITNEITNRTNSDTNLQNQISSNTSNIITLQTQVSNLENTVVKISDDQNISGIKNFDTITCNNLIVQDGLSDNEMIIPYKNTYSSDVTISKNAQSLGIFKPNSTNIPSYNLRVKIGDAIMFSNDGIYFGTTVIKNNGTSQWAYNKTDYIIDGSEIAFYSWRTNP